MHIFDSKGNLLQINYKQRKANKQSYRKVNTFCTVFLFHCHHLCKLFIVYLTITINTCFLDHFFNLFICYLLSRACHHMAKLCCTSLAPAVLIRHAECCSHCFTLRVLHFSCHPCQEFWEVSCAITISVYSVNSVL